MRAILIRNLDPQTADGSKIKIVEKTQLHHLLDVVRIKMSEDLLILNGDGLGFKCSLSEINKKFIEVLVKSTISHKSDHNIDLLFCYPKKDAFEEIIRNSIELGIRKIIPVKSMYSQQNKLNNNRLNKIIESAIIQSNAFYWPEIVLGNDFNNLENLFNNYDEIVYFSSIKIDFHELNSLVNKKTLMIIGPEAGLAQVEEEILKKIKKCKFVHLPTNILTAPSAICTAYGFLLSKINK